MSCPCQVQRPRGTGCRLEEYACLEDGRPLPVSSSADVDKGQGEEQSRPEEILIGCEEGYELCPRYLCWRRQIDYLQRQAREELALTLPNEEERQRLAPDCPYRVIRQFEEPLQCSERRYVLCAGQQGRMASELHTHAYCLAGERLYLSCGFYFQARKEQRPPEPGRQACRYFDPFSNRCVAQEPETAVTENRRSLYCLPEMGRMTGFRDCPQYIRRQLAEMGHR